MLSHLLGQLGIWDIHQYFVLPYKAWIGQGSVVVVPCGHGYLSLELRRVCHSSC